VNQNPDIEFLPYSPDLRHHFKAINEQWITAMFAIEEGDSLSLDHPEEQIIDRGGKIWFARNRELGVVGVCALLKKDGNCFELTKMGVLEKARGMKVGEGLLRHVLADAETMNLDLLFLLTNTKCEAAIHLYEKNGFAHDAAIMNRYGSLYERCNVAMRYTRI
jgi:N-acetylglutamate synthase-like GNAT family acetyltransferase